MNNCEGILKILPEPLKSCVNFVLKSNIGLNEIRLTAAKPVIADMGDYCIYFKYAKKDITNLNDIFTNDVKDAAVADKKMIDCVLNLASDNSLYAFEKELKGGFITIKGGHRIGVCGTAVYESNKIKTIKNVSSVIIRIAKTFELNDDCFTDRIFDGCRVKNTIIAGKPKSGKTTILRSTAKYLSDCAFNGKHKKIIKVGIIDERMEIASVLNGENMLDTGINSFVMNGINKTDGCEFMIRAFSPDVIIMDEIWSENDFNAVKRAIGGGCSVICSCHASYEQAQKILGELPAELCVYIEKSNNTVSKKYIFKNERGYIYDSR